MPNERELDSTTVSYHFIGYSKKSRRFKFYNPSSKPFFKTGNIKFIENGESTKVNEISFKESIGDPTVVITITADSEMIVVSYTVEATQPARVVITNIFYIKF